MGGRVEGDEGHAPHVEVWVLEGGEEVADAVPEQAVDGGGLRGRRRAG